MGYVVVMLKNSGELMGNAGGRDRLYIGSLLLLLVFWCSLLHIAYSGFPAGLPLRIPVMGYVSQKSEFKVR